MDAAEIDKELDDLAHKAEHLRALYEQYFMGIERIEPLVPRKDVERRIFVLRREQLRNTAQRFKFNTLVQRFNTMQQYWSRTVREMENGTYRRDVIRAAARFGDSALTVLGKKKTAGLLAAVAKAQDKRSSMSSIEDTFELEAGDLIEEEEDDEDEAPTPPKLPAPPVQVAQPAARAAGLGQGDLPLVGPVVRSPTQPAASTPAGARGPLPQPVPPPQRSGGLRWGPAAPPSDPGSAVRPTAGDVQRRVAELAAQVAPSQPQAAFGELDLDFDEAPRRASAAAGAKPMGALPEVKAPPVRGAATGAAATGAAAAVSGFGVLDMPLDGELPASLAASPSSPGSGVRAGARPSGREGREGGARPQPPAASAKPESELPDQRIRQIYAQYVETKRSTQESTAGVTFEKLAASLRAQADKLKSAHPTRSIDYEVVVKDGKTHLKPVLR